MVDGTQTNVRNLLWFSGLAIVVCPPAPLSPSDRQVSLHHTASATASKTHQWVAGSSPSAPYFLGAPGLIPEETDRAHIDFDSFVQRRYEGVGKTAASPSSIRASSTSSHPSIAVYVVAPKESPPA